MGYAAHVQRLLAVLSWWAVPLAASAKYTELSPEGALLRGDVFGGCKSPGFVAVVVVPPFFYCVCLSWVLKVVIENGV